MVNLPRHTPLLYSGVHRGIPIFLIFDQKHRLWIFLRVPTFYVSSKNMKKVSFFLFSLKIFSFFNSKNLCILHGHVFLMICLLTLFVLIHVREIFTPSYPTFV